MNNKELTLKEFIAQGYWDQMRFKTHIEYPTNYLRTILRKLAFMSYKIIKYAPVYKEKYKREYYLPHVHIRNPEDFILDWNTRIDKRCDKININTIYPYFSDDEIACFQRNYKCEGCYNNEFESLKGICKVYLHVEFKLTQGLEIPNTKIYIDNNRRKVAIRRWNNI